MTATHWENCRRVTDWRSDRDHNGRAMRTRWVATPDGWDEEIAYPDSCECCGEETTGALCADCAEEMAQLKIGMEQ